MLRIKRNNQKEKMLSCFSTLLTLLNFSTNNTKIYSSKSNEVIKQVEVPCVHTHINVIWSHSKKKKLCLQPSEKTVNIRRKHKLIARDLDSLSILTVTDIKDQIFYLTDHILPFNTELTLKQKRSLNGLYSTILTSNPRVYDIRAWSDLTELARKNIISIRPYWYRKRLPWLSFMDNIKKVVLHSEDSLGNLLCRLIEAYPIPNLKPVVFLGFIGEEEALLFRQEFAHQFFLCDVNGNPIQQGVDLATPEENMFLRYTSFRDFFRVTNVVRQQLKEKGFRTISLIVPNFTNNNEIGKFLARNELSGTPIYRFKDNLNENISFTVNNPKDNIDYTLLSFNKSFLMKVFRYFSNAPTLPQIEVDSLENYLYKITDPNWNYTPLYIIPPIDFLRS